MAYEYDVDLQLSILVIFAEAQTFPVLRGHRGFTRGRLEFIERTSGYRIKVTPCSIYQCPLCRSVSPTHGCPYELEPPTFCRLCGSPARDHDCPVQRQAEARAAVARQRELDEAERLQGAALRRAEAQQWRAEQEAQRRREAEEHRREQEARRRQEFEERRQEREARQAALAARRARVEQTRLRIQEQNRQQAELAAQLEEQRKGAKAAKRYRIIPKTAKLEPPPLPTFCRECGSAERDHKCKVQLRLAAIEEQARKANMRKRRRMPVVEQMEIDTLPTAAE